MEFPRAGPHLVCSPFLSFHLSTELGTGQLHRATAGLRCPIMKNGSAKVILQCGKPVSPV